MQSISFCALDISCHVPHYASRIRGWALVNYLNVAVHVVLDDSKDGTKQVYGNRSEYIGGLEVELQESNRKDGTFVARAY